MRIRKPDQAKARSILQTVVREMKFVETLPATEDYALTIVRNIYENFRMLGDALLAIRGKEATRPDPHTQMIEELFTLNVTTTRPLKTILNLKDLRHNINYKGYQPSIRDAEDALDVVKNCYLPLLKAVQKEINKFTLAIPTP